MARVLICDICGIKMDQTTWQAKLLENKKVVQRLDICHQCFEDLAHDRDEGILDSPIKQCGKSSIKTREAKDNRKLEDGMHVVKSKNIREAKTGVMTPSCLHVATSYEPPNVVCKECGEKWEAK